MKIWKNTSTLNGYDKGLDFTENKSEAELAFIGSKSIDLNGFLNLKAIFRAGIGKENVPEKEARNKNIFVQFPSKNTTNIIYEETAHFTCGLIFRMLYSELGSFKPWTKNVRGVFSNNNLLIIGNGNIGSRISKNMSSFLKVKTYDVIKDEKKNLKKLVKEADCITLNIPGNKENISFFDKKKLSWMKDNSILINTARGNIVDEISLYNELKRKRLRAAFDVFWEEPYDGILCEFYPDFFFMTPHVASTSKEFLLGIRNDLDNLICKLKS